MLVGDTESLGDGSGSVPGNTVIFLCAEVAFAPLSSMAVALKEYSPDDISFQANDQGAVMVSPILIGKLQEEQF